MHPENVVDPADARALAEEGKFCLRVLTELCAFMHGTKSWSAMYWRGPTATPSDVSMNSRGNRG